MHNDEEKISLILKKYIKPNKINHAYLIETNCNNRLIVAEKFVKIILDENNGSIEELSKSYDLEVLKTNNQVIKKEDILNLKEKFKTKPIYNKERIYIIEEAEKLNDSSANSLLKFLEEPDDSIIAILIASNKNQVINTIVSRCQNIRVMLEGNNQKEYDEEYKNIIFSFAMMLEDSKEQTIAYENEIFSKMDLSKNNFTEFLKDLLFLYDDVLHYKIDLNIIYFNENIELIKTISEKNTIESIAFKTNAINECLNRIKYNVNIKMLLDKLILLMSGVD